MRFESWTENCSYARVVDIVFETLGIASGVAKREIDGTR